MYQPKAKTPLHDWVCDSCGRKVEGRRKVPRRCHGMPMRPMGSPWKYATDAFYARADVTPGWLRSLPDDYWISEAVIARLQVMVDERKLRWESSVKRKPFVETQAYTELL